MPDPDWTLEYNMAQDPAGNQFTGQFKGSVAVNPVTSGNPANRRLEIDTTGGGGVVYIQDNEPILFDPDVGLTGEVVLSVAGGNAGFEFTFLDRAILLDVQSNNVEIYSTGSEGSTNFAVDMTIERRIRVTLSNVPEAVVYIDGVQRIGPAPVFTTLSKPVKRFLFWGEVFQGTGGLITFRELKNFVGGPVAPG